MASIVNFLPKKTRERIERDNARFEKAFNLPKGTVDALNKAKSGSSSGGSSSSSSQQQSIDLQKTAQAKQQAEAIQQAETQQQLQQAQIRLAIEKGNKVKQLLKIQEKNRLSKKQQVILNNLLQGVNKQTIYKSPYVEQVYVGSEQGIPFYKARVVDPNTGEIRSATREEEELVRQAGLTYMPIKDKGKVRAYIDKLTTKSTRGKTVPIEELALVGIGFGEGVVSGVKGVVGIPKLVYSIITNPSSIKEVPASIIRSGAEFGELLRVSPTRALGRIGGEIFVITVTGKTLKITGKLSKSATRKLRNVRFSRVQNKIKFQPVKDGAPRFVIKSVEQIKKRSEKLRRNALRKGTADMKNLNQLDIKIRKDVIEDLTNKLYKKFEQAEGITYATQVKEQVKDAIRNKLESQIPKIKNVNIKSINRFVNVKKIFKLIRRKFRKIVRPLTKRGRKAIKLKKIQSIKKQGVLDREIEQLSINQKKGAIEDLTNKLYKKFEQAEGITYTTQIKEQVKDAIRNKLNARLNNVRSDMLIKNLSKNRSFLNSIMTKINSITKRFTGKAFRRRYIAKLKKIKQKKLKNLEFEQKEITFKRQKRKDLVNRLVSKYERVNNLKLNTQNRELLKNAIEKKLKKGKFNRGKIDRVLNTKEPTILIENQRVIKKITETKPNVLKQRPNKRIKTLKDFEEASNFVDDLRSVGSGQRQQQVLLMKQQQAVKQTTKIKPKLRASTKQSQRQFQAQGSRLKKPQRTKTIQIQRLKRNLVLIVPLFKQNQKVLTQQQSRQLNLTAQQSGQISKLLSNQQVNTKQVSTNQIQKLNSKVLQLQAQMSRTRLNKKLKTKQVTTKKRFLFPRLSSNFMEKRLSNSVKGYYVVTKKRGRLVKLAQRPLTREDAKDYLAHSIDNNLTRTAFVVPAGMTKNVVKVPKNIRGYFNKTKNKFRTYRIRQGKKRALINGYIEKSKFISDTRGEKRQLRRSISPMQRKVMLANLKRARQIRMKNLKRKRR